jgi:iron complex outermembrane receptor protein
MGSTLHHLNSTLMKKHAPRAQTHTPFLMSVFLLFSPLVLLAQRTVAPPSDDEPVVRLSPFEVSSTTDRGYIASATSSATKTATPMVEVPHSIQVLNKEFVQDVGAATMADIIRFTANVSGGDPRGDDALQIRGFGVSRLRNGIPFPTGNAFSFEEVAGIERIEVIRGASAVLYGTSSAGGLINIVDKRPLPVRQSSLTVQAGDNSFFKGILDTTGPLLAREGFGIDYRFIAAYEDSESWRWFGFRERLYLNGSVKIQLGKSTSIIQRMEFQDDDLLENYAKPWIWFPLGATIVSQGVLLNLPDGFHRGDSRDFKETQRFNWESTIEHLINENWSVRGTAVYSDYYAKRLEVFISNQSNNINVWPRFYQLIPDDQQQLVAEFNLLGNVEIGPTKHQILAGINYLDNDRASANFRFNMVGPAFDVFNPQYGVYSVGSEVVGVRRLTENTTDSIGFFLQDQVQLFDGRLHLIAGVRHDKLDQSVRTLNLGTSTDKTDKKTSPRYGVLWRATPQLSVYASMNESFIPSPGTVSFQGQPFPTPTAEQIEVGAKFVSLDGRFSATIAAFENAQQNLTTTDVINPGFSVATGEVTAKGGEIQLAAYVANNWQVMAAYGILDGEITKDNNPARLGLKFENMPESSASLWTKYDFTAGSLDGLSLGFGFVRETDRITRQGTIEVSVPDYTVFNALVAYRWNDHRLALNVNNVFDESHVLRASGFRFFQMGDRRVVRLSYTYTFR